MTINTIRPVPVALCPTAAALYRAWTGAVAQIPGGTHYVAPGEELSPEQREAVQRIINTDYLAGLHKDAYVAHVKACPVCKGERKE